MKNIISILKELGIEVPSEKTDELNKAVADNYKTVVEFDKKVGALEKERDTYKKQSDDLEVALKDFEGKDFDGLKKEFEELKLKSEESKKEYEKQIAERDFNDALEKELAELKFTSLSAKNSVMNEIKGAGLKVVNGKILGLKDYVDVIKERDKGAFVDEQTEELEQKKAKFTESNKGGKDGKTRSSVEAELSKITDHSERQKFILENKELFGINEG